MPNQTLNSCFIHQQLSFKGSHAWVYSKNENFKVSKFWNFTIIFDKIHFLLLRFGTWVSGCSRSQWPHLLIFSASINGRCRLLALRSHRDPHHIIILFCTHVWCFEKFGRTEPNLPNSQNSFLFQKSDLHTCTEKCKGIWVFDETLHKLSEEVRRVQTLGNSPWMIIQNWELYRSFESG